MGSRHRGREQPPARRPRVVIEKRAQSQPAPAAAGGARWGTVKFRERGRRGREERPPELPWISISPEIMSHAVWLYHRFGVRFRDAADLLAQHGLTVSDDAIRLWCLDFDSADARRLTRRQGRLGDIWHRDKVFVRYGSVTQNWGSLFKWPKGPFSACHSQVDAKLVDRPPRGWARASREPAMLGTNNGRRPQLDKTVRSHQRGIGRHRPTDAVAACPKHVGVQGESCLQPQRLADTPQRVGVVGAGGPAVGEALLRRQIGVFGEDPSGPLGHPPQAVDLSDGAGNGRHQRSTPHRSVSERSTRATVERQPAAERLVIGDVCGPQPYAAATAASRASWHRRAPAGGRCRGSSVDACRPLRRAERRRAPRVCRRRLTRPSRSHDEPRDPWGRR